MGKKHAGSGGRWLAAVRKVFRQSSSSKDVGAAQHGEKQDGAAGEEDAAAAQEPEVLLLLEHFPASETSAEASVNEGGSAGREGEEEEDVAGDMERARALAVAAAEAAPTVVGMAAVRRASQEERAAVRIQAYYRGYLARRALRALRGLVRLQALVRGHQVRRQVHLTMRCMQALVRAQARVHRARRVPSPPRPQPPSPSSPAPRSAAALVGAGGGPRRPYQDVGGDEAALTRQQRSTGRTAVVIGRGDGDVGAGGSWDGSSRTLADARAEAARRRDAAARRERALAYAYQQRHDDDDGKAAGGFQWLERWMAAQVGDHGAAPEARTSADVTTISHAHHGRPPAIPGYMAATRSARAKARSASHVRSRSGCGGGGDTSTSSGQSADSSFTADRTPPRLGGVTTRPGRVAYT